MLTLIFASTVVTIVSPAAQASPLVDYLEARVPDELAVEGIVLGQRELVIKVEEVGDKLLISLIATPTGRIVASSKVDDPPPDREASLAIVTQITATLYTQYTALPVGIVAEQPPSQVMPRLQMPAPQQARTGLMFELGFGYARPGAATGTAPELGLGFGVGAWIYPGRVALLGRFAMATIDQGQTGVSASYIANTFIGANVQYWYDDHFWIAGGPGFAAFSAAQTYDSMFPTKSACDPDCIGVGLDARVGYSVGAGSHQLDLSLEAIGGYYANAPDRGLKVGPYPQGGDASPLESTPGFATTLMAMIGYRFL